MDSVLLHAFQQQIWTQCKFVLLAADQLKATQTNGDSTVSKFYAIQNLLNAAANISKALWGSGGRKSGERKLLRDSLGVADGSALSEVVMRNNYEHFDDRLDTWWRESSTHATIDLCFLSKWAVSGTDELDWFRNYDPATNKLTFWSQEFDIERLTREVEILFERAQDEVSKTILTDS